MTINHKEVNYLTGIPGHLTQKIDRIPMKPGVYQMKDKSGNIIYIGKSKTLRARVRSYFTTEHEIKKLKRLVLNIADIDFIVTDTHMEARILECELIKKIKPMYNVQFKNDARYKYLKVETKDKLKPLNIVNDRENEDCFGPYKSQHILLNVVKFFENIYPITNAKDKYFFTYHAIPKLVDEGTFEENRKCLIELFDKKECMEGFIKELENKMDLEALNFQFEKAAIYRDIIANIKYIYSFNIRKGDDLKNKRILVGERLEDGYKIFYIYDNHIVYKKKYKRLSRRSLESFMLKGKQMEISKNKFTSEKEELDFKSIIRSELEDKEFKTIIIIDNDETQDHKLIDTIHDFMNKLTKIER